MPSNIGMTIFEHLIAQEARKQQEFERKKLMEREQQMQNTEMLSKAVAAKQARDDADFDRQYKMAELWGKYAGASGAEGPPTMRNPVLQEMASGAFMGGRAQRESDTWNRNIKQAKFESALEKDRNLIDTRTATLDLRERQFAEQQLRNEQKYKRQKNYDRKLFDHWKNMDDAEKNRFTILKMTKAASKAFSNTLIALKTRSSSAQAMDRSTLRSNPASAVKEETYNKAAVLVDRYTRNPSAATYVEVANALAEMKDIPESMRQELLEAAQEELADIKAAEEVGGTPPSPRPTRKTAPELTTSPTAAPTATSASTFASEADAEAWLDSQR